jgi:sugar phosphate isomerase/epimerase
MIRTFSTLGCPDASLDEILRLAQQHACALELRAIGGTLDVPAYLAGTCGTPAAWAEKVRAAGVRVVALDTSFRLMAASAEDRAALLEFVPWAEALGGVSLRVFDAGTSLTEAEVTAGVAELCWWQEQKQANGWRSELMIETHDALVSTGAISRFVAAAPAGTRILWDALHTWSKGGEDPVQTWRQIKSSVVHVHVKDSISRPSERHPYTYVLPGDGEFPMAPLLAALRADGFAGPLSLEWERKWHPYLPPVEDALVAAAQRQWW